MTRGQKLPPLFYLLKKNIMSILSAKTDHSVIKILEKCLALIESTGKMNITKIDDFEISLAKNMIKSVIDNNNPIIDISPHVEP